MRWSHLFDLHLDNRYRPGGVNCNADALSRALVESMGEERVESA